MTRFDHSKYQPYRPVIDIQRTWPDQVLDKAPDWCSVDLRDGNQALVQPMSVQKKLELFDLLVELGFKEIEVGFPSASNTEREFTRRLIDENRIPDDVTIQVLTQARKDLVDKTFSALEGVKRAIVHVYNSTSTVQREQVFRASKEEIIQIAVDGARWLNEGAARHPDSEWWFQYSPESFTGTEVEYAVEVCDAVINVWEPQKGRKVCINLPATVEKTSPNVFADQVEYFCTHVTQREHVRISLHTHNDRGCAIAASELGLMAGADRIEGTLFGNGERTGNMDIMTMAMNFYSHGVDPKLNLSDMMRIIEVYERSTGMPVHQRHPWAGDLVYAAFSGSHQDAIRKSTAYHQQHGLEHWDVAYLPIDPRDLGRRYEEVVRINSQSGKGGVAHVLERDHSIHLPKWMLPAVSEVVQQHADQDGEEISSRRVWSLFETEFLAVPEGWQLAGYDLQSKAHESRAQFRVIRDGVKQAIDGAGQGLIEALVDAISKHFNVAVTVKDFDEHAMTPGTEAKAIASIMLEVDGETVAACCIDEDSSRATLQATLSAVGRSGAVRQSLRRAV